MAGRWAAVPTATKAGIKSQVGQPCHLQNEVKGKKKVGGGGERKIKEISSQNGCAGGGTSRPQVQPAAIF